MSSDQPWTVGRLLTWTTGYLKENGSDTARLDAEVLLAHARRTSRLQLYTAFDEVVDDAARGAFREMVKQRAQGKPVAYLVGSKEFYSLAFRVTPDVLIPRPETEHVVMAALDRLKAWLPAEGPVTVADVGTGSGAIAVALARHAPRVRVKALDISRGARELAQENAHTHGVGERVEVLESDLLTAASAPASLDMVLSNPPYVTEAEWEQLPASVRDYEPKLALVGGPTGLEVTARLVSEAAGALRPGGWLILEIHSGLAPQVRALLEENGTFDQITLIKDLAQLPRVIQAQRKNP